MLWQVMKHKGRRRRKNKVLLPLLPSFFSFVMPLVEGVSSVQGELQYGVRLSGVQSTPQSPGLSDTLKETAAAKKEPMEEALNLTWIKMDAAALDDVTLLITKLRKLKKINVTQTIVWFFWIILGDLNGAAVKSSFVFLACFVLAG